jgi:phosphonate transport system ATP-binding protein
MLEVQNITKVLPDGRTLLKGISFSVKQGEFVGILGPSGAGKTLTMRCCNGLMKPTSGNVFIHDLQGNKITLSSVRGNKLREARKKVGVIFHGFNLVKRLTAIENVMIGRLGDINPWRSLLYGFTEEEMKEAQLALEKVKIKELAFRKVESMSGGEMQRVAIARAIFQNPLILLADEPIANLDPSNAKSIMKILRPLAAEMPIVGVFHQPDITQTYCTRIIAIKNGLVVYDGAPGLSLEQLHNIYEDEFTEFEAPGFESTSSILKNNPFVNLVPKINTKITDY